jgi:hypothetical protein
MARRLPRSPPKLLDLSEAVVSSELSEPSGPIDLAGFTRRLYGQAVRVLVQIEAEHETMPIDDQCKLLSTLGVLGKNLIAMVKACADSPAAGATVRKYAQAFQQPHRAANYTVGGDGGDDGEIELNDRPEGG